MLHQIGIEYGALTKLICVLALAIGGMDLEVRAQSTPDFATEVYPLLENNCVKCHGPEKQKGSLRLDVKESALKPAESGETPIIPGHAAESRLIRLVSSKDDADRMPPKGERLSAKEIGLLVRWINAGAVWNRASGSTGMTARAEMVVTDADRKHWSYLPLQNPPLPKVAPNGRLRTPVDHFIVAKLAKNKISLSDDADAFKVVRRIYFDLIGLPPTPEQVDTFVEDYKRNPDSAVSSLVDKLLDSLG